VVRRLAPSTAALGALALEAAWSATAPTTRIESSATPPAAKPRTRRLTPNIGNARNANEDESGATSEESGGPLSRWAGSWVDDDAFAETSELTAARLVSASRLCDAEAWSTAAVAGKKS
jgi:hypothetical protein